MKLAFSSNACPTWGLPTMLEQAKQHGFDGIELQTKGGLPHLPQTDGKNLSPADIAELTRNAGIEVVCLASSAAFHMRDPDEVARNQIMVRRYIDMAANIGCPFVRIFGKEIPNLRFALLGPQRRETVLERIAAAIRELVPHARDRGVTLLIENAGDFSDSVSMWHLVEAASSPNVKCCWSPLAARLANERPTIAVPRLRQRLGLVRICDAVLQNNATLQSFALPGEGDIEIPRLIQLLKGMIYRGYLVLDWPKAENPGLAEPDVVLPAAAAYLKKLIDEEPIVLPAYKGDKFAPRQSFNIAAGE
ncbi:MAG: sugar phosphate isomerase/epimerase family protein [Planctomycetota bacterium]